MRDVSLWTRQFFQSDFDLPNDYWVVEYTASVREKALLDRREELQRYELESYAAIGRRAVKSICANDGYCVIVASGRHALGFMAKGMNVEMFP